MNILLATYSYYPYNHGGTEVYVFGLAALLKEQGHHVYIIAGMPPEAFDDQPLLFEDDLLRTVKYMHENIPVTGVVLRDETTQEIYRKFRSGWVNSWQDVLKKLPVNSWDVLHLHAHTSAMGEALAKACKQFSPGIKIFASYHLPLSCVKGTLLYGCRLEACIVKPAVNICTACFISSKQGWPMPVAKTIAALLPAINNNVMPTTMRLKYLVKEFQYSFAALDGLVSKWHVFSKQIKNILLLNAVPPQKILLLQHGVNPLFFREHNIMAKKRRESKPVIFLFPSRFTAVKGFDTLLQAWCSLPSTYDKELWMAGEKKDVEKVLAATERKDIRWLGSKTQSELAAIMKKVHCTLIPSEWIEIGPLVFHEALAAGSNVIASDIGGCKELAEHYKENSTLFAAGNANKLAEAIASFRYKMPAGMPMNSLQNYEQVLQDYQMEVLAV